MHYLLISWCRTSSVLLSTSSPALAGRPQWRMIPPTVGAYYLADEANLGCHDLTGSDIFSPNFCAGASFHDGAILTQWLLNITGDILSTSLPIISPSTALPSLSYH